MGAGRLPLPPTGAAPINSLAGIIKQDPCGAIHLNGDGRSALPLTGGRRVPSTRFSGNQSVIACSRQV